MFMNLAHRGASEYSPENTLSAFFKAIEVGATGIETDIRRSRDGVLFLHHDKTLDRTTSGRGNPGERTWAELSELDAGAWFSPIYTGERLVDLGTFLYQFGRRNLQFALELKEPGIEEAVLQMIEMFHVRDKTTITSFAYDAVCATRQLDPTIRVGHLLPAITPEAVARLTEINATQICPKADQVTSETVQYAKSRGLSVRAWGVATPQLMENAIACGVDGMTINFPDLLTKKLAEH
jgi:glycerophosphoryl diester phosphodiesterase